MSRFKLNIPTLTALVNEDLIREQASERPGRPFVMLPINRIEPDPLQPRQSFSPESIRELADNIRANGLINPLTVRVKDERYSLVCGERRHRACKVAGLTEVPCVVREMSDAEAMFLALTENILREDLNDMDRSRYLLRLKRELDLTWGEISRTLGLSEARVKQLAGLSALPEALQQSVQEGRIAGSAAQRIAAVRDDAVRDELIRQAQQGKLTRKEISLRASASVEPVSPEPPIPYRNSDLSEPGSEPLAPPPAVPRRPTVLHRLFELRRLVVSLNGLNEEEREEAEIIREHLDRLLG
jgi:ParB family chromosome partitioning protein